MTQIMRTDPAQSVFLENHLKATADILRNNQAAQRIYAYVLRIFLVISAERPKDDGSFEIVFGHRRHRASIIAG